MPTNDRTRIQNYLMGLARDFDFPTVAYDSNGDAATGDTVNPSAVLCNEVNSAFAIDQEYGRAEVVKRTTWRFVLKLGFGQEVSLMEFEDSIINRVAKLNPDLGLSLRSARCILDQTDVEHPTTKQAAGGTMADLFFTVIIERA